MFFQICGHTLGKAHSCFDMYKKRATKKWGFFSEFGVEEPDLTSFDHRALTFWTN